MKTIATAVAAAAVAALGVTPIEFEGSDSLDDPSKVFE